MSRRYQPRLIFADMPSAVEFSIETIRKYANDKPYWGGFSGGKDSVVIKQLVLEAGVPCEWHYGVTTVDPPEVVRFVHDVHPDVRFVRSKKYNDMADMVARRAIPTQLRRQCCIEFKERPAPAGQITLLGIRAEESARRARGWQVYAEPDRKRSDARRWPHAKRMWLTGISGYYDAHKAYWHRRGLTSAEAVFDWWLSGKGIKEDTNG